MQYKIPVQIEKADNIILGLSLKQLAIIMTWWWIGYAYFKWMEPNVWTEVAAIPAIIIIVIAIVIAVFKNHEMTFIPFVLSLIRININSRSRFWMNTVDSFQPIDVGYVENSDIKVEEKIDFKSKMDKINEINDKLKKL